MTALLFKLTPGPLEASGPFRCQSHAADRLAVLKHTCQSRTVWRFLLGASRCENDPYYGNLAETHFRILVADRIGGDAGLQLPVLGEYCPLVMASGESPSIRRLRDWRRNDSDIVLSYRSGYVRRQIRKASASPVVDSCNLAERRLSGVARDLGTDARSVYLLAKPTPAD